ncbi:hypothetical protein [Alteromonas sp. BMJM2]|uniref:hypothetical protein n=1 Tax=Alteromonas sp. BMJM2 TaxID=2954241 RepID=UPI0022B348EA|nr:hypothetical protein [Alteromonas sp. BMJM2]
MPMYDALGRKKKHNAMNDTWGHLYPDPGTKYPAVFHVATSEYGDTVLLSADYEKVGNPLDTFIFSQITNLVDPTDEPTLYRIDCHLWFFKNCHDAYLGEEVGKPIKVKIKKVWSN